MQILTVQGEFHLVFHNPILKDTFLQDIPCKIYNVSVNTFLFIFFNIFEHISFLEFLFQNNIDYYEK